MKQRIISAAVGIGLLVIVIALYETPVLPCALALLSSIAVYEVLVSTHFIHSPTTGALYAAFAGASIFLIQRGESTYQFFFIGFVVILICYLFCPDQSLTFQCLCVCAFTVSAIPLAFSTILKMDGRIYLVLTCIAAWVTDASAFFVGRACGKHKLAPLISPNKTVEGSIGGLLITTIIFPLVCYGYWFFNSSSMNISIPHAVLNGFLCALFGMAGDLFASVIKRESGIKDFGKIMPGHGGVMDRFDSFLFAAPALFFLNQFFPIFTH